MPEQLDRPKLTRTILEGHNIYYHEKVYARNDTMPIRPMPNHVNKLREALLNFSDIQILDNWKSFFREDERNLRANRCRGIDASDLDLQPPASAYIKGEELRLLRSDWKEEIQRLDEDIYTCKIIANEARKLDYDSESGWMDFLRNNFFRRFQRQQDGSDNDN